MGGRRRANLEALFFLIDSVVILVVAYYGMLDDRRARGVPMRSPFRFFEGNQTTETVAFERKAELRRRRDSAGPQVVSPTPTGDRR